MPASLGYFDASILVRSYVVEPGTAQALRLLRRHVVVASAIAPVELASALRRCRTEQRLSQSQFEWISTRLREDKEHWTLIEADSAVLTRAEHVTTHTAVKTLDAIHLASALTLQDQARHAVPFITGDLQQRAAAEALGLDLVFVD